MSTDQAHGGDYFRLKSEVELLRLQLFASNTLSWISTTLMGAAIIILVLLSPTPEAMDRTLVGVVAAAAVVVKTVDYLASCGAWYQGKAAA